jgi:hypothetical protein
MAIDSKQEALITLTEATKLLPRVNGKRVHISTLWRWCRRGLKGISLEYLRCGAKIVTSHEAMNRFFTALAQLDENRLQASIYKPARLKNRPRSDTARQRDIENANAILVRAKIIQTAPRETAQT